MPESIMNSFQLGLGWDTRLDLDSSILLLDANGNKVDNVYFGKKKSDCGSIIHSGDNQTGQGDGDDETIKVNLTTLPAKVDSVWPVINVYEHGKQFDDVKGAYCRIQSGGSELIRFNLSDNMDNTSNGNIMANFKRVGNSWSFKALGYYTKNTKKASEVVPICKEVI